MLYTTFWKLNWFLNWVYIWYCYFHIYACILFLFNFIFTNIYHLYITFKSITTHVYAKKYHYTSVCNKWVLADKKENYDDKKNEVKFFHKFFHKWATIYHKRKTIIAYLPLSYWHCILICKFHITCTLLVHMMLHWNHHNSFFLVSHWSLPDKTKARLWHDVFSGII